jgi:uncharacterized repeat protein (TIGR04076 family)
VEIRVKEILGKGFCPYGLQPGDCWFVDSEETPARFCSWALISIWPFVSVMRFGGTLPWEENKDTATACCPDPNNPVIFEIKRLAE